MSTPLSPDSPLLRPETVGAWSLANRVWLAPLTRNRADADGTPNALQAEYYAQRAGAGLIVSEGSQPSAVGQGYPNTPGVYSDAHKAGWARVADAVHEKDGTIVVQLMHAGRISHTDSNGGATPVSSSAVQAAGQIFTANGMQDHSTPRALEADELPGVAQEFAHAAKLAVDAGIDGVELHAANGYLLHQFQADGVNARTDAYGGSAENRARFTLEVAKATVDAIGADRVGIRISPGHPFNDITEDDLSVYEVLVSGLAALGLAYLHVIAEADDPIVDKLRSAWPTTFVLNTGFGTDSDRDVLAELIENGTTDAVAVGRPFLANPDLVRRWTRGAELNEPQQETFYGGGAEGYTDYPALQS
ncbi:N-ethylmaleimide reductase [Pseudonocardia sediminis]|uniref:N-ethylmaleimide reductase n=1 Tax=Pseudonocardia sediminis TaxID=1397368 RepID=A0A4Q7V4C6_PSEST|nr:alkene reductase [Pseudonocardia sediminis]RZT88508.1 N-ethylmaleimide reductase [Pseudonocardia sediminis]